MKKNFSLKYPILITFTIESLFIAIAVGRAILLQRNPMRYFGEGGFVSWLSICQLLFIAFLCWRISRKRRSNLNIDPWKKPKLFWQILTAGFVFLALDEYWQIHENLDKRIHTLLNIEPTPITDRLDDIIILIYVLFGLIFLYLFRRELKKIASSFSWFIWGFSLTFLTIFFDVFSSNPGIISPSIDSPEQIEIISHWLSTLEEIVKIFAQGAFIIAFYSCLKIAEKFHSS